MRSGKKPTSCVPCSKRRVRCDKLRPCSNCRRRPQDVCTYPELNTSVEARLSARVVELEQQLSGRQATSQLSSTDSPSTTRATPSSNGRSSDQLSCAQATSNIPSRTAGLYETGREAVYVETSVKGFIMAGLWI